MDRSLLNEKIELFKNNRNEDPVISQSNNLIVLKLYNVQRVESVFQEGKRYEIDFFRSRTRRLCAESFSARLCEKNSARTFFVFYGNIYCFQ